MDNNFWKPYSSEIEDNLKELKIEEVDSQSKTDGEILDIKDIKLQDAYFDNKENRHDKASEEETVFYDNLYWKPAIDTEDIDINNIINCRND